MTETERAFDLSDIDKYLNYRSEIGKPITQIHIRGLQKYYKDVQPHILKRTLDEYNRNKTKNKPDVNLDGKRYIYSEDKKAYVYKDDEVAGLNKPILDKNNRYKVNGVWRKFITPNIKQKEKLEHKIKNLDLLKDDVTLSKLNKKKLKVQLNKLKDEHKFLKDNPDKDKHSYNETLQRSSYIPNKFVPMFITDSEGNYKRVTPYMYNIIKNSPSGDYYDGTGRLLNNHMINDRRVTNCLKVSNKGINDLFKLQNVYLEHLPHLVNNNKFLENNIIKPFNKDLDGSGLIGDIANLVVEGVNGMKQGWNVIKSFGKMIGRKIRGSGSYSDAYIIGINPDLDKELSGGAIKDIGLLSGFTNFLVNLRNKLTSGLINKFDGMGTDIKPDKYEYMRKVGCHNSILGNGYDFTQPRIYSKYLVR